MKTKIFGEFENEFKINMFNALSAELNQLYSDKNYILIGNYILGSFSFDAILVTDTDIFLFEFKKNDAGTICINDEGWLSPSGFISCGIHHNPNPWLQVREKRNILFGKFKNMGHSNMFIKTVVLFENPFKLQRGNTSFNFVNHKWFLFSDLKEIKTILDNNSSLTAPVDFLEISTECILLPMKKDIQKQSLIDVILSIFRKWRQKNEAA